MLRRIPAFGNALIDHRSEQDETDRQKQQIDERVEQRKHPELPPAGAPAEIDVVTHTFEPPFHRTRGFVFNRCRPAAALRRGPEPSGFIPAMYKYREKIAEPSPPSSKKQKRPDFRDCSDFRPVTNVSPHILSPFHPVPPPLHSQTVARTRTRKCDDRLQQKQQTRRSAVFTDISRVPHGVLCVCRDALEFLHHREHKDRREETEDDEYRPDGPQRNTAQ